MDPQCRAQDVLRCSICAISLPSMHCNVCNICLCKSCVGEHLLDLSKSHKVVPFEQRNSTPNYPICTNHTSRQCEIYCEQCEIPICVQCASSKDHKRHEFVDIMKIFERRQKDLQEDLKELETSIYPNHQKFASNIQIKKANLQEKTKILTTDIDTQGEIWHREIDAIVKILKFKIHEIESNQIAVLDKQQEEMNQIIFELQQVILNLKKVLVSNDMSFVFRNKSRNTEFRNLPPEISVSLPIFHSQKIDTKQLQEQFGSLSSMSDSMYENEFALGNLVSDVNAEYENEFTINTPEKEASMPKEPKIIVARNAGHGVLNCVVCLNDNKIWTSGQDSTMKLYNLQGELLSSIQTESGNWPWDIAITKSGDLLYTDPKDKTVNKVRNNQIQMVTRLENWIPRSICGTHTGDILVLEVSYDEKQTQIVRYTDSSKKQTIRFNDDGKPLYSIGYYNKFLCENRNLDICVSDYGAGAIVVANQTGKLRFTYTGPPGTTKGLFFPCGIATDSQSQILTADSHSQRIHILDQDGQFLRDIKHNDLHFPRVLCINNSGNLFVAEWEAQVFDVGVQEIKTSKRLNLENGGNYKLFVTKDSIDLGDFKGQEIMIRWPLKFIRRYGFHTRNLFMLEAGRRCETGEGCFNFFIDRNQKELKMAIDNAAYDQSEGAFSVKFRTLQN